MHDNQSINLADFSTALVFCADLLGGRFVVECGVIYMCFSLSVNVFSMYLYT